MSILIPATTHIISWVKQNQLDLTTYYVRAVVRNIKTDAILDTLDLTDLGSGRFSKTWNVPQDPTGYGVEISIIKTVYEDAAYTTVSGIYGSWEDRYLIFNLKQGSNNTGGFGGGGVDYDVITAIIKKQLAEALTQIVGDLGDVKQTLGERVRELFRIGKKADAMEELETRLLEAVKSSVEAIETAKVELATAAQEAGQSMSDAMAEHRDTLGGTQLEFSGKVDEELTYAVSQFTKVMEQHASRIADDVAKKIEQTLQKPLRIQRVEDYNVVGSGAPAAETGNKREGMFKRMLQ